MRLAYDEVTERITNKDPTSDHMKNSLHHMGIAGDLLLYKNGKYLDKSSDHEESERCGNHVTHCVEMVEIGVMETIIVWNMKDVNKVGKEKMKGGVKMKNWKTTFMVL